MDDLNAFVVILAESADNDGSSLEVQRSLMTDVHDKDTGMDTYCLCLSGGATHYGGVKSWCIEPDALSIVLDAEAATSLDLPLHFRIGLHLTEDEKARLHDGLMRVFEGDLMRSH